MKPSSVLLPKVYVILCGLLLADAFCPISTRIYYRHSHLVSPESPMAHSSQTTLKARYEYSLKSSDDSSIDSSSGEVAGEKQSKFRILYRLPKTAYRIYRNYAKRLWSETSVDARTRLANEKVKGAIRNTQHILQSNEYADFSDESALARDKLLESCEEMLGSMPRNDTSVSIIEQQAQATKDAAAVPEGPAAGVTKKKPRRSILFGALMGAAVACWVFSGNYIFTGLFCLMTILGQLEYYRMVMNTGVYPARRISIIGACAMFLTVSKDCD